MATSSRYLLSAKTLAVMRVGNGELSKSQEEWAAKYDAVLVAPVDQLDTPKRRPVAREDQLAREDVERKLEVVTRERDNLRLKIEVLQDVVSTCGGEGEDDWDMTKLVELAEITREIL